MSEGGHIYRDVESYTEGNVSAIVKRKHGAMYELSRGGFVKLLVYHQEACEKVEATLKKLVELQETLGDQPRKRLVDKSNSKDPQLTQVGVLANFFNLIKVMDSNNDLNKDAAKKVDVKDDQVRDLFRILINSYQLMLGGLRGPVTYRGIGKDIKGEAERKETLGYVVRKRPEDRQENAAKKMPKLKKDEVFLSGDAAKTLKGNIHLHFDLIEGVVGEGDKPISWTIIHEASHKFARTVDVNAPQSYTYAERRAMDWKYAVRNAQHYMYYAALAGMKDKHKEYFLVLRHTKA